MKIYCIENKLNGKKYVGLTKGKIERRFKSHRDISRSDKAKKFAIHKAMALHGIKNFVCYELDSAENYNELCEKEKEWIKKLDTRKNGYNETDGGEGTIGVQLTEKQKKYLSELNKQKWNSLSEEEKEKRKKQFLKARELGYKTATKGKTWVLSDEAKKNISASKKGIPKSKEERKKLSESRKGSGNPNYGRKHSLETIEKMRKAALLRKLKN